ncbi:MAG: hypothetical protein ACI9IL_000889 [Rickettsiales bacterium]
MVLPVLPVVFIVATKPVNIRVILDTSIVLPVIQFLVFFKKVIFSLFSDKKSGAYFDVFLTIFGGDFRENDGLFLKIKVVDL